MTESDPRVPLDRYGVRPSPFTPVTGDLFVYGTLMFDQILQILLGRVPLAEAARAIGWQRRLMKVGPYPTLVPKDGASVVGRILIDLSTEERLLLDVYENGEIYRPFEITLETGTTAWTYGSRDPAMVEQKEWTLSWFREEHLDQYVGDVERWIADVTWA
jgi:gamma-glutamylcyclotransferase (GGCT)/AIG2-like uncharacterized protein YtfP